MKAKPLMDPIATYSEVRFEGKRAFDLYADKIMIKGKEFLQSDYEMSIPLETLDPQPDILRFRSQLCAWGMWSAIICTIIYSILVKGLDMSFASDTAGSIACIGMGGLLLMLATLKKVEYTRFKNKDGIAVLDIARSGKNAKSLEPFIKALRQQIKLAKEQT